MVVVGVLTAGSTSAQQCLSASDEPSLEELARWAHHDDFTVRREAMKRLARMDVKAVPLLIGGLTDPDLRVREQAAQSIAVLGPAAWEAAPALSRALSDPEYGVRRDVLIALTALASRASDAVASIAQLLREDPKYDVRIQAVGALLAIGPKDETVIRALVGAFTDRNDAVARSAAEALARIGPAAIPILLEAQRETEVERQTEAELEIAHWSAWALGAMGADAVPLLIEALCDSRYPSRSAAAASALGMMGPPALAGLLETMRTSRDKMVVRNAAFAIGLRGMRPIAEQAVPDLIRLIEDIDNGVRRQSIETLASIGSKIAVPAISRALHDPDPHVRDAARSALDMLQGRQ
jgi:HEAT repeat protein